jgi:copper homeostasis protein
MSDRSQHACSGPLWLCDHVPVDLILEVIALDAADARAARDGGADRLELVADMRHQGLTPALRTFAAVRAAVDLPVRVMLRNQDGYALTQPDTLRRTATALRQAGADEFVLGFLDADGNVDVAAIEAVLEAIDGCRWTFHRALDHAADRGAAWRAIAGLPGLDQVLTAGSADGVSAGLATLQGEARSWASGQAAHGQPFTSQASPSPPPPSTAPPSTAPPSTTSALRASGSGSSGSGSSGSGASGSPGGVAGGLGPRILAGGGLLREHVGPLLAAGVRAFHSGSAVRPGSRWDAPVDPALVADWRARIHR